jgi:hypothetical protein
MRTFSALAVLLCASLLAGCAGTPTTPFDTGAYSRSLLRARQDPSPRNLDRHAAILIRTIDESKAKNNRVPPGIYAEYGYLLWQRGQKAEAEVQFHLETTTYPEAGAFITLALQILRGEPGRFSPAASRPKERPFLTDLSQPAAARFVTTKGERFPLLYTEKPRVVLVLPPVNTSTTADAGDQFASTFAEPASQAGYYVLPIQVTTALLKRNGVSASGPSDNLDAAAPPRAFGADAVLSVEITKWIPGRAVYDNLRVEYHLTLTSVTTGQTLWKYERALHIEPKSYNQLVDVDSQRLPVHPADYVPYLLYTHGEILRTMPVGPYHLDYLKDRAVKFTDVR